MEFLQTSPSSPSYFFVFLVHKGQNIFLGLHRRLANIFQFDYPLSVQAQPSVFNSYVRLRSWVKCNKLVPLKIIIIFPEENIPLKCKQFPLAECTSSPIIHESCRRVLSIFIPSRRQGVTPLKLIGQWISLPPPATPGGFIITGVSNFHPRLDCENWTENLTLIESAITPD